MKRFLAFAKHEFLRMLPPTIYFLVIFHVLAYARQLMLNQWGVQLSSSVAATMGALIIGKAVLVTDALPVVRRVARTRLAYDIAFRTLLYLMVALLFKFLEELIPAIGHENGLVAGAKTVFHEIQWPRFLVVNIFMASFLLFYNVLAGVMRVLGRDEFLRLLWQPVGAAEPLSGSEQGQ